MALTKSELRQQLRDLGVHIIKGNFVRKSEITKAVAGKWSPSAEDLYDYANNVEFLYNGLQKVAKWGERYAKQLADDIIEEYNEANKAHPERLYDGTVDELIEEIVKNEIEEKDEKDEEDEDEDEK